MGRVSRQPTVGFKNRVQTNKFMEYQEVSPQIALRPYINCFWAIKSTAQATLRDRTFPDGCQEMVFSLDSNVLRDNGDGFTANPRAELVGQMTKPYDILTEGKNSYFGIKFFPHSFSAFTRESVHDLRDQSIDLRHLLGPDFTRTIDGVFEAPTFERFIELTEDYFLRRLAAIASPDHSYRVVDRAVGILLKEKEAARIDELPQRVGASERSLQLMFRRHVGLSPKQLLKMIRFQTTFRYLNLPQYTLTEIAHRCGYYDHAHFAHDFKSLSGFSPSAYRIMDTPLNRFFLNETSLAFLCNYRD